MTDQPPVSSTDSVPSSSRRRRAPRPIEGRAADNDTVAPADPSAGALAGGGAESRFLTADDGVRLYHFRHPAKLSPPWAVVVFHAGIASHAGWFSETAAELNHKGITV